jgi:predicted transposase YbfD/YdcC
MYLDEKAFNQAFITWISYALCGQYRHVSVDGKTLRGSYDLNQPAIHLVSAVASELGVSLGQWKVNEKSNEITAIPALLELLALESCVVSIDAIGCQKSIASQIIDQKADYLLAVKDNQPTLLAQIKEQFQRGGAQQSYQVSDWAASHNELVSYQVQVSHQLNWLENTPDWKALASLVHVHTQRASGSEDRFYISSVEQLSAQRAYQWTRGHWSVENQLHWQLDVTFREDEKRVRKEQAPQNLSLLRKIALNLLQLETSRKLSKAKKRKLAAWDELYLIQLISNAITLKT